MSGRVGVVTVTYNSAGVLPEFLESVWRQTHPDFLLYIIDSGSTDGTPERLREIVDPRVRCSIQEKNVGFAAGSNLGIQMALEEGCEAVMLLNNDIAFGPELFQKLVDGLETYRCDMVTPKILYYDDPKKIWAAGGSLNRWLGYRHSHAGANEQDDGRFDRAHRVTFAPFCCMVIRSEVFRKVGLLDEAYFTYVEDVDYCYRALKANLSIWVLPECRLLHKVSSLTGSTSNFTVEHCTRNRMYFLRKHLPAWRAGFWYRCYRCYYALEFAAGRTSRERWDLRRSAAERGWRLAGESRRSRT
jgi:GT2 family glycosyltransferase